MNPRATEGLEGATVCQRLVELHERTRAEFPEVSRVTAALYDPATESVSLFRHSGPAPVSLACERAPLRDLPGLCAVVEARRPRLLTGPEGSGSSYVVPFFQQAGLRGFLVFDSEEPGAFGPMTMRHICILAELAAESLLRGLERVGVFRSTLHLMTALARFRDAETGNHLGRVSHYARLIARNLRPSARLADDLTDFVFLFTPAHDIAKIAIPDSILCKPGALTPAERSIMEKHVTLGLEIVDKIVDDTSLGDMPHLGMLRNIVLYHHERLRGSGYPLGLSGDAIPFEARIVGVADVFDALRSPRPYKEPWTTERALEYLHSHRDVDFDADCVDALLAGTVELEKIASPLPGRDAER